MVYLEMTPHKVVIFTLIFFFNTSGSFVNNANNFHAFLHI